MSDLGLFVLCFFCLQEGDDKREKPPAYSFVIAINAGDVCSGGLIIGVS